MPTEIEAKLKVDTHETVRRRLSELGGQHLGRVLEVDTYYDRPDASLFAKDRGLRVRKVKTLDGKPTGATLTFKGAVHPGTFKARREIELSVSDADVACQMLEALGFERVLRFEKRRELWRLAGCVVALDELPMLGTYIEIEGPSAGAVQAVREQLVLSGTDPVKTPYIGLLIATLREQGRTDREVRFERA